MVQESDDVDKYTINYQVGDNFEGSFKRTSGLQCNTASPPLMIGDSWSSFVSISNRCIVVVGEGKYDGIDAACRAGEGAIDPFPERLVGRARADGIGGTTIGIYSPPILLS